MPRTYLNSGQPKPCKEKARPRPGETLFVSICVVCGSKSYALKGPSFLCIGCFLDLKAGIKRHA